MGFAYVFMNPNGYNWIPWSDGGAHTTRDIAHELGHVLGEGHINCATQGNSLMSGSEGSCYYEYPQPVDTNNYHLLYHADPVQNLTATSPSAGTVNMNWSQIIAGDTRTIPNEKSFTIKRLVSGTPVAVKSVAKNTTSTVLTSQTPGPQTYRVYSDSDADNQADWSWWPVTVNVTAPTMTRVQNFTLNAYTSSQMKLTWTAVTGAHHYEYCVMANPTQNPTGSTYCADISGTSVTTAAPFPSSGEAVYYFAARAVDAYGNEGPLSNRGAISGFNETTGGVKYKSYHTLYKTGSSANKINAFNKNSSSRYLAFTNTSTTKKKSVSSGKIMYDPGPYSWSASDWQTGYGPLKVAQESKNSSLDPREEIGISTACMYSMSGCP